MRTLTSISLPDPAIADRAGLDAHRIHTAPVVVISPHNQCDCRCVMCDIWKIRDAEALSAADLERQIASFRDLGVRWVVFTGGEPQKNSHLPRLARMLRVEGIRITLLTAGLLLDSQAETIAANIDDVIVSLDGPPALHDRIRRVPGAFERLASGVRELRRLRPDIPVRARCTVQKLNHASLRATTASAHELALNSISFLAADVSSEAFNRPSLWTAGRKEKVAPNAGEVEALEEEIHRLIDEHAHDLASGFIVEDADKLQRIVLHFRASLGQVEPVSPRCNAPWVSAVVEAGGDVRPCFFHRPFGNIHEATLGEILNGPRALQFRRDLDISTNPTCRQCVCSLYVPKQETFDAGRSADVRQALPGRERGDG
jgi:MoaA/NifB/PqqE/SkfB family radical SAM enzyme